MLVFPIAWGLIAVSFLGMAPSVTADVLEREQCWCRKRASHADAHKDASFLSVVYHNNFFKYPIYIEHSCTHGYCVGIVGEPFIRNDFCTTDRATVNTFCYHRNLIDADSFSINQEERFIHVGVMRENDCKQICQSKFNLPVAAGPFAPTSRKEVFTLWNMDDFIIKVNEGEEANNQRI